MITQTARMQSRFALLIVYAVVFVSFFDNHSLLPIIAPYAKSLGASVALVGLIVGAYSAVNLLGNLGAGYWMDRVGRKPPLIAGLVIVGGALALYPFATDPYALLGLRVVHGFGAALMSPASLAYIGDAASPKARGRAMAFYGAAIGLTVLIGPPLAGVLRDRFGYAYIFAMLSALMFLVVIPAFLFIGENFSRTERASASPLRLLQNRRLGLAYISAFCLMFSLGGLIVFLPFTGQTLGLTSSRVGMLFASFALAAIIVQALPFGRMSDRWGRERAMMLGLALIALSLFALALMQQWETLMIAMFAYGIGFGFLFPAMTALMADETTPQTRGTASGIFTAVYSLGVTVGTSAAGALAWLQQTAQIHPFQVAASIVALGWLWVAWNWMRR
ncbi:MAG: MFS transporter [Anaerolineales bacterium]|nr:MFS transporter [Anaerolineales bacterium]